MAVPQSQHISLEPLFNSRFNDGFANAIKTIDYPHHEIHDGSSFTTCKVTTLPLGGLANILIVTPNTTKWAHFFFKVVSDSNVVVNFYEAPDYAGGTALTAYNRNRNSSKTSGLTLTHTSTDSGGGKGTLIWTFAGGANKQVGQSESDHIEFILKQNTKYMIETVGAQNDITTALLDWYEHTNAI